MCFNTTVNALWAANLAICQKYNRGTTHVSVSSAAKQIQVVLMWKSVRIIRLYIQNKFLFTIHVFTLIVGVWRTELSLKTQHSHSPPWKYWFDWTQFLTCPSFVCCVQSYHTVFITGWSLLSCRWDGSVDLEELSCDLIFLLRESQSLLLINTSLWLNEGNESSLFVLKQWLWTKSVHLILIRGSDEILPVVHYVLNGGETHCPAIIYTSIVYCPLCQITVIMMMKDPEWPRSIWFVEILY